MCELFKQYTKYKRHNKLKPNKTIHNFLLLHRTSVCEVNVTPIFRVYNYVNLDKTIDKIINNKKNFKFLFQKKINCSKLVYYFN